MRVGWQTKTLGDLCEIELGKTPARANPSYWDEKRETGNVWLSIADLLKAEDRVVVNSKEYVSDKGAAICKLVPKGTLLVSFKLTLGRLAFAGCDLFTNEAIAALTIVNERELSKEFLFYCLTFFDWVKVAENDVKLKGMTLNKAKLKVMPVSFPPLPEQQRIVAILDEAFDGIATAKANAEKNLQNARALFESHLQSVFTERGEGWVEKSLGEMATFRNGINFTKTSKGDPIRILGVKDFQSNHWAPLEALDSIIPDGVVPDSDTLQKDDVVFVRSNGNPELIGRCLLIGDVSERTTHSGFTIKARLQTKEVLPTYLCHFLKSGRTRREMIDGGNGANIKSLNQGTLSRIVVTFPSRADQSRIVQCLEEIQDETQRLESIYQQKLTALDDLKKSLLHQAFSGQL
jgi:type I restriction enzyme, S subunit